MQVCHHLGQARAHQKLDFIILNFTKQERHTPTGAHGMGTYVLYVEYHILVNFTNAHVKIVSNIDTLDPTPFGGMRVSGKDIFGYNVCVIVIENRVGSCRRVVVDGISYVYWPIALTLIPFF